jgi:hypothetical protein
MQARLDHAEAMLRANGIVEHKPTKAELAPFAEPLPDKLPPERVKRGRKPKA